MAQPRVRRRSSRRGQSERRDNSRLWRAFKIAAGVAIGLDFAFNNAAVTSSVVGLFSERWGYALYGVGIECTEGIRKLLTAFGAGGYIFEQIGRNGPS